MNALFAALFIVVVAQATSGTEDDWCGLCKEVVAKIKDLFEKENPYKEIYALINEYCAKVPDVYGCKSYWRGHLHRLEKKGKDLDVELACKQAGQCPLH
ncbi:unnamed protein product [Calicophoron daubneyi]|uniref:Saposin B-type domain-containing protein n=1 Tax=Calicophoron daubneyi TaxID=300641 RepID=A0AAV2TFP9_CALDB